MKNYLRLIGSLYVFWMLFFFSLRMIFIVIQLINGFKFNFADGIFSVFYGAYMDLAMASYIMLIPLLLFFFQRWLPFNRINYSYSLLCVFLFSALYAGDAVLYKEWGFRLDKAAFAYLLKLREAASFVSVGNSIALVFLFLLYSFLGIFLFKTFYEKFVSDDSRWIYLSNLLIIPLLIIPMRGGLDIIPMNPGKVYFSNNPFSNHAALNVPWNLMYSALQAGSGDFNIHFMDDELANRTLDTLFADRNSNTEYVLNNKKPNVLFIVLESFTANLVDSKYQGTEVTPRLNEWLRKGIYCSNAYASGDRTEIGMAAIFSGFPAQPQSAIVHYPRKTEQLPSLIRNLNKDGYHSSFYYGGDASFASMNSYLLNSGCEYIMDKHQFPKSSYNAKWGVHDHILFEKLYDEIKNDSALFLKICLSLSSHPPFDIPESPTWENKDEESQFLNTAHYTDKHLGILLDRLSLLPVWNNLLIVISADHGARFPGNNQYHVPQKFKIPIWFGGGVVTKTMNIDHVSSQNDIAATVLYQLGLSNDEFLFSKNMFSGMNKAFAYYAFNNGFGWVDEHGVQVYSNDKKEIILSEGQPVMNIQTGKAFLQKVLSEFNKK